MSTIDDVLHLRHAREPRYTELEVEIIGVMQSMDGIVAVQRTEIGKLRLRLRKIEDDWGKERTIFRNRIAELGTHQEYLLQVLENTSSASVWEDVLNELDINNT
jgi:hypothetical protein